MNILSILTRLLNIFKLIFGFATVQFHSRYKALYLIILVRLKVGKGCITCS